jgi:hypothetical protein
MVKFKNYIFLLFLGLLFCLNANAQIDKTFWFAVPHLSPNTRDNWNTTAFFRISTFDKAATVTVSQPANGANFNISPITIPANSSYKWDVSTYLGVLVCQGDDAILNKGLLFSSTELITIYYDSGPGNCNPDMFSLKGTNGIGKNFIVTAADFDTYWDARHEAYIIATEDNTTVTITPSVTVLNHTAGSPFSKNLNKGEVYILSSLKGLDWTGPGNSGTRGNRTGVFGQSGVFVLGSEKMGGSIINSDKPISVVNVDDLISPPGGPCGGDLNGDQLIPTNMAGKEFVLMPGGLDPAKGGTDFICIFPTKNNVTITIKRTLFADTTIGPLSLGQFTRINNRGSINYITSTDSVLVYQLSGQGCEIGGAVVPALTCTGSQRVSFVRNNINTSTFKINVLVKNQDKNNFTFKNNSTGIDRTNIIQNATFTQVSNSDWYSAIIDLNVSDPIGYEEVGVLSNSSGVFHLGIIADMWSCGGTAYGYFSNFGLASGEIVNTGGSTCETGKALLQANVIGATGYQWKRNGTTLSGATNSLLTTCLPGTYEVVATAVCPATLTYSLPYSLCQYACVDKIELRLGANCRTSLELASAVLPSDCIFSPEYYIKVNDLNPTNGAVVDGISPEQGWVYGVYLDLDLNAATPDLLICQGRVVAKDYTAPAVTAPSEVELWCDDISSVLNKEDSWKTATYKYFTGNLNKNAATTPDAVLSAGDECSGNIQIRVTDRIDYTECGTSPSSATGTIYATITRTFNVIDLRGSDTTVTQLIKFKRPALSMVPVISGGAAYNTINGQTVWSTNGVKNPTSTNYINSTSTPDMIVFNGCESPSATGSALKEVLRGYLRSIYRVGYLLPGDGSTSPNGDTASIFDNFCNYSVDFTYKEYANCNNGKKFDIVTMITDFCTGSMISDPIILSFEDASAPVFAAASTAIGSSSTTPKNVLGTTSSDPIKVSVGTNECKGSLRLGTAWNMRDLASLFNLSVSDNCSADKQKISLNYKFETGDYWNDAFYKSQGWTNTDYTIVSTANGPNVIGLPIGKHRMKIIGHDGCNNRDSVTVYFDVIDNVAPVMICDDEINVTLTSNSSSNYFLLGNSSDSDLDRHMSARLYVKDINEGSRDNCTIDSMYVRRKFNWTNCSAYLKMNMEYDVYSASGVSNGTVGTEDFEAVSGEAGMYYTPSGMQYVEYFCCDAGTGMVELWASDTRHYNASGGNWNYCWSLITVEDKSVPFVSAPDLNKTYNSAAVNYVSYREKEWFQGPGLPRTKINGPGGLASTNDQANTVNGTVATVAAANAKFGIPDIYGLECSGDIYYTVLKKLTCDTGVILRIWDVEKVDKKGNKSTMSDTQLIWVEANHDYTITVPADVVDAECSPSSGGSPTFDEDGCDLLAISGVRTTTYDGTAAGENACKKLYHTWTIINWCQVPNQFNCSSADPMNYARVIPRLNRTGTSLSPASASLPASAVSHRYQQSNTNNIRSHGTPTGGVHELQFIDKLPAATGANWPTTAKSGTYSMSAINGTSTYGTLTDYKELNVPSNCTDYNVRTFAWQYTQVIKISDKVKPFLVANNALGLQFTPKDDVPTDDVNWNEAKKVFGVRGNYAENTLGQTLLPTGTECQAKIRFTFEVSDACPSARRFTVESSKIVRKTSPLSDEAVTGIDWQITSNASSATPSNGVFTVNADKLSIDPATGKRDYQLVVTFRDDCGNASTERIDFTVADIKAPAPVCVQNLTASFMPDGQGGCMAVIQAKDVFQDVNRNWDSEECSPSVAATIAKVTNGVAGTKASTLTLTGDDKEGVTARVYITDAAGNENYCTVNIFLEDNACQPAAPATIAGAIQTESKVTVEGVQVNLSGQAQKSYSTGVNGNYVFSNLTKGMDYTVTPSLNKGFLNGVSTYDLILISKHILGNQPLTSPYKLIAADVNNSKSITTLDMIQLRKLILNIEASFPSNQSWRFVDASYTFPNPANPWATSFPEVKNVNDLTGSMSANFVAIKIGDVNGNAIANSTQGSIRNLTANLGIEVPEMNLVAGNEYKVDFTAADLNGIEGFQFTLNLDKKGLELVDLVPGIATEENFGIFAEEGVVTASWNGESKGGVLFSLVVRAKGNTNLSEVLNLNSRYTAAEAYKGGEVLNVGLNFNAAKASANYELYQNTPNPFTGETVIGFNLPIEGEATLTIQDVTGRTLKVIKAQYAKGYHQVSLKSKELTATGVLTYTLKAADYTLTKKMIVVE